MQSFLQVLFLDLITLSYDKMKDVGSCGDARVQHLSLALFYKQQTQKWWRPNNENLSTCRQRNFCKCGFWKEGSRGGHHLDSNRVEAVLGSVSKTENKRRRRSVLIKREDLSYTRLTQENARRTNNRSYGPATDDKWGEFYILMFFIFSVRHICPDR